jgi:type II secretory pathway pseudopilin PulG
LPPRCGFTLIELIVVVSVVIVLISLLLPAVQQAREAARRLHCSNNLMQIGLALRNYEATHECLPPGSVDSSRPVANDGKGYKFGWTVQILPALDQPNLYAAFDFSVGVYDKANATATAAAPPVFHCPSSPGAAPYAGCHHHVEAPIDVDNSGVLFLNSSIRREDLWDGASQTIFVGEAGSAAGLSWASGTSDTLRNTGTSINSLLLAVPGGAAPIPAPAPRGLLLVGGFNSAHASGANFVFGDGAVHYISRNVAMKVFQQLGHRADGELPAGSF